MQHPVQMRTASTGDEKSLVLVDQSMWQRIIQTFKPSPDSSSFQRPKSDMNMASGCPQFAKLSILDEGNNVKNDVLFLKCIVDTSKIVHPLFMCTFFLLSCLLAIQYYDYVLCAMCFYGLIFLNIACTLHLPMDCRNICPNRPRQ